MPAGLGVEGGVSNNRPQPSSSSSGTRGGVEPGGTRFLEAEHEAEAEAEPE